MTQKTRSFIFFPVVALLTGAAAGFLSNGHFSTYAALQKPAFAPPAFLFPVVWSVLYILMGVGAARVSQSFHPERENALLLFSAQLIIGFFWPIVFFVLQTYAFAFICLCLLFILFAAMTVEFGKADRPAAWIQLPCLLWLLFAGVLNLLIAMAN